MHSSEFVTITFFKFEGLYQQWWAMRQMQAYTGKTAEVPGLSFCKMLGSGSGDGFSTLPDFSTYAFLLGWQCEEQAVSFFTTHSYFQKLKQHTVHQWTVYLQPVSAKGLWNGVQPFAIHKDKVTTGPVAILTRATIYPLKLPSFWRHVPRVSQHLSNAGSNLLFAKGIGEIPLLQQATFSVWKDRQAMVDYAYKGAQHRQVIAKTRQLGWYREELFAEFVPVQTAGHWPSVPDLLQTLG